LQLACKLVFCYAKERKRKTRVGAGIFLKKFPKDAVPCPGGGSSKKTWGPPALLTGAAGPA
jgi:hypothetical protein